MIEKYEKIRRYVINEKEKGTDPKEIVSNIDHQTVISFIVAFLNGEIKGYEWKRTRKDKEIRRSEEYKEWHKKVLKRDKYTCQECGTVGGKLEVHHLKPLSSFPELATKLSNGQTLCNDCHKKTDSYGSRAKNYLFKNV
jgi:5-methylcytosine-specific restriction endonuclease McrA